MWLVIGRPVAGRPAANALLAKDSSLASWAGGGWHLRVGGSPAMQLATLFGILVAHSHTQAHWNLLPGQQAYTWYITYTHVGKAGHFGLNVCVCEGPLDRLPKKMHCRAVVSRCPLSSAGLRRRWALPLVGQAIGSCSGESARPPGPPPQLANEASFGLSVAAMR